MSVLEGRKEVPLPVPLAAFVWDPEGKLESRFSESKLKIILEVVSEPIDLVKKTSRKEFMGSLELSSMDNP